MEKDTEKFLAQALADLRKAREENERLKAENARYLNLNTDLNARLSVSSSLLKTKAAEAAKAAKELSAKDKEISGLKAESEAKTVIITEQKEIIDRAKKYLIEKEIMERKAVDALFGKASAKTKNIAKEAISTGKPLPVKEKPAPQKRGRKPGKQNFSDWNRGCYEETVVEVGTEGIGQCEECGKNLVLDHVETYEKIIPVTAHVRKEVIRVCVFRCVNCGKKVKAKVPESLTDCFGQSACTPSLAGFLAMLSCGLFLPGQRIADLFAYAGTPLSKELATRYLMKTAEILKDFNGLLRKEALKAHVLHMDETTWLALDEKEHGTDYIWSMTTAASEPFQVAYYMYAAGREYASLDRMAGGYEGTIVSDSYGAYFRENVHQLCMSHLRKYLFDYIRAASGKADSEDVRQVSELLEKCNAVFAKERKLGSLTPEEKLKRRQDEVKPLLDDYFETAAKYYDASVKDSKNHAIGYGLSNRENYYAFLDDAAVPITNNRAEQTMRKAVLKKVSSMFSTSTKGAEATCLILTVVQTARLNGLCPDRYVRYLLENHSELSDGRTAKKYLPWSKSIPDSVRFTKAETEQAKEAVEKNLKKEK